MSKGGDNMNDFVFKRQVDKLGRIVIPIEMRRFFGFEYGDLVKIIPTENGVLLVPNKED